MKIISSFKIKPSNILVSILAVIFISLYVGNKLVVYKNNTVDALSNGLKNSVIVVDAGHGGIDGGAVAVDGTLEKDINLQIAVKLKDILESMGVKVIMTRTDDDSIHDPSAQTIREKKVSDIKNRLSIIENTENSIFVSIHQNKYTVEKYNGAQVFYSKNNSDSAVLAESIRMSIISNLQKENTREIKAAGSEIYLLKHSTSPAVMVECGFLSNYNETKMLKDDNYQNQLSFLIAIGIIDFLNNLEDS